MGQWWSPLLHPSCQLPLARHVASPIPALFATVDENATCPEKLVNPLLLPWLAVTMLINQWHYKKQCELAMVSSLFKL
jgi:P2-related tail formation protein